MNRLLTTILLSPLMLATAANAAQIDPAAHAAAVQVAVGTCASCHGARGRSQAPKFPVLAGQHAEYLQAQLQAFKAQSRGDADAIGYMWGMASPLDNQLIAALADYYSQQSPPRAQANRAADAARGQDIYANGVSSKGIPACATCHGPAAAGTDQYPRLAGQHAPYVLKQLRSFQNNMRDVAVMHGVAEQLDLTEMRAVADYLQSLGS